MNSNVEYKHKEREGEVGVKKIIKKKKGFSLIEVVIVMAIMAILIGIMAPKYKNFIGEAKKIEVKADSKTLSTLVDLYESSNEDIPESTKVSDIPTLSLTEGKEKDEVVRFINGLKTKNSTLLNKTLSELNANN